MESGCVKCKNPEWISKDFIPLTSWQKIEAIGINSQTSDCIKVGHHGVDQFACVVVKEADVSILVGCNAHWQCWVADHTVHLTVYTWI